MSCLTTKKYVLHSVKDRVGHVIHIVEVRRTGKDQGSICIRVFVLSLNSVAID